MENIFKTLFCKSITLEQLSDIMGYDEETVIEILEGKLQMESEEAKVIEDLIKQAQS